MNITMCPQKTLHVKTSSYQNGQHLSTRRQKTSKFSVSQMSCFHILTIFRAQKFYIKKNFACAHTVSYSETVVKHYLFIVQTNVEKFCIFQNAKIKKYLPKCFEKGLFLTGHTR